MLSLHSTEDIPLEILNILHSTDGITIPIVVLNILHNTDGIVNYPHRSIEHPPQY